MARIMQLDRIFRELFALLDLSREVREMTSEKKSLEFHAIAEISSNFIFIFIFSFFSFDFLSTLLTFCLNRIDFVTLLIIRGIFLEATIIITIYARFINGRSLFASFNKGRSIRSALYEQSETRLTTAQTRTDTTMNERRTSSTCTVKLIRHLSPST